MTAAAATLSWSWVVAVLAIAAGSSLIVRWLVLRFIRSKRRTDGPEEVLVVCNDCRELIPANRYNCAACGWPHVPEKNQESE